MMKVKKRKKILTPGMTVTSTMNIETTISRHHKPTGCNVQNSENG
jgi:hypothetical protein